ncbi:MAG TPA: hypothetical protein VGF17_27245, partial [Phytomonospora sp.]
MSRILAIDPGNTESGYALIDADTRRPIEIGKVPNDEIVDILIDLLAGNEAGDFEPAISRLAIEMVASYGMSVGKDVFETCVWIGRYQQTADIYATNLPCDLVYRKDVKLHH